MKKHVLLIAVALVGSLSTYAQVKFGVKAGLNVASTSQKVDDKKVDGLKSMTGFHVGVIADISLAENFALQPGLLYSKKGFKFQEKETSGEAFAGLKMTTSMNYLEVPINFLYKTELGSGKFFGGFGPYVALGLGGKTKYSGLVGIGTGIIGADGDSKVKFDGKKYPVDGTAEEKAAYNKDSHYKALDAGANFILGYELKNGLQFSVNYSLGLTNSAVEDKESHKNRYFGVSAGFLFGGKK